MEDELFWEDEEELTVVDSVIDISAISVGLLTGVAIASVINAKLPVARTVFGTVRNTLVLSLVTGIGQMAMTRMMERDLHAVYQLVKAFKRQ